MNLSIRIKKQVLGLKTDISQRFDTQIHVLDDLTNRRDLDQQNLKELIEDRNTQQQVDMKVTTSELEETNTRQPISRIQNLFHKVKILQAYILSKQSP